MRLLVRLAAALALCAPVGALAAATDCEPARCAVQSTIDQECNCTTASNHGRYVSCVAHVVRRLTAESTVPNTCRGKVTRCAARSTCGKTGFVACHIPTDVCDIPAGMTIGTCTGNPALTCLTSLDCGSRCRVSKSAELCTEHGGTVGAGASCCRGCTP